MSALSSLVYNNNIILLCREIYISKYFYNHQQVIFYIASRENCLHLL